MEAEESSIDGGGESGEPSKDAHVVEIVVPKSDSVSVSRDEIAPLLVQSDNPKINIFTLSYPRRKREQMTRAPEMVTSPFTQFRLWAWNGSRYSGLFCMALSSVIYCFMEVFSDVFSAQSIPLFEIAFTRCTVILVLSFVWLRRSGQPIFGPPNVRTLLVQRAVVGYFSLLCFVYCIQRLPLSQALILSFMTPVMASLAARFILHEKLNIAEIGGLACSFFGVIFIFRPMFPTQGVLDKAREASDPYIQNSNHVFVVLVGLFSSIAGGISYCLIRAGAKTSDQPVLTVFSFGIFASPAAAICTFTFQEFVFPGIYSFLLMLLLGVLAFFAEIFLARGLQLEKTSKVANILYLEAVLSQLWSMSSSRIVPSFGRLIGCSLILLSACCTMYTGPEKEQARKGQQQQKRRTRDRRIGLLFALENDGVLLVDSWSEDRVDLQLFMINQMPRKLHKFQSVLTQSCRLSLWSN